MPMYKPILSISSRLNFDRRDKKYYTFLTLLSPRYIVVWFRY